MKVEMSEESTGIPRQVESAIVLGIPGELWRDQGNHDALVSQLSRG